jgi:hypothetical protein
VNCTEKFRPVVTSVNNPAVETTPRKHLVVVVDGTEEIQKWLDEIVAAARRGGPGDGWPHPHPDIPHGQVTVGQLAQAVEKCFAVEGRPWSVVRQGFPPPPGDTGGRAPSDGGGSVNPRPRNSDFHNLMHNLLGDFH